MPVQRMYIGKDVNRPLLYASLLLIFAGAVIASKFDTWYAVVGGAFLAVMGCLLNQSSISWVTDTGKRRRWYNIFR
jgi:hypothetical protein